MKILLAGGAGYIGSHTAVELINNNFDVIIADNFINSSLKVIDRAEKICGVKIPVYDADLAVDEAADKIFKNNSISAVIHFAGLKSVEQSNSIPLRYYKNNINTTIVLLEKMKQYNVKKLIFSSSATVYGNCEHLPANEKMPVQCLNPYGRTKHMNEQIINDYSHTEPDFSAVILRYFNPVGAHESGLIGEDISGRPNNLMPYITKVAAGKISELEVYGCDYDTNDGTGVRDYIHVVDLAKGHVAALKYSLRNSGVDIFNLGTGRGYSVLELIKTFERVNNVKIPYKIAKRRQGDIAQSYADVTKANKYLNWKAEKTLEQMCADSWNWQINNPEGYK